MTYLLSVDPGLRKCGAALWRGPELVAAELVIGERAGDDVAQTVTRMKTEISHWEPIKSNDDRHITPLWLVVKHELEVVCEYPRTYGGRASRGDANDLVGVALVVGAILGRLACPSRLVLPEEWKGNAPKPDTKAEYERDGYVPEERARAALSADELACVRLPRDWRKKLDVWDAVGIGLWALKQEGLR